MPHQNLDVDTLVKFYAPFQPSGNTGWNESGLVSGPAAYFVSQGSEYRLYKPDTPSITTARATGDVLNSLQTYVARMTAALAQVTSSDQSARIAALNSWIAAVNGGQSVEEMTVTVKLTHIRNYQDNDDATLTLLYVYCDPIGVPLLVQTKVQIAWGGLLADTVNTTLNLYSAITNLDTSIPLYDESAGMLTTMMTALGIDAAVSLLEVCSYVGIALTFVSWIGYALINYSNDGGRVNFLAVIAHTLHRVSASTTPVPNEPSRVLKVDPERLGIAWYNTSKASTDGYTNTTAYPEGVFFGTYPPNGQCSIDYGTHNGLPATYPWTADTTAPYLVGLPEMSWATCGRTALVTAKVYSGFASESEDIYSIYFLVLGPSGELLAVSSAMQSGVV